MPRFAKDLEFVKRYLALPEECEAAALYFGGKAAVMKAMAEALKREVFRKNVRTRRNSTPWPRASSGTYSPRGPSSRTSSSGSSALRKGPGGLPKAPAADVAVQRPGT